MEVTIFKPTLVALGVAAFLSMGALVKAETVSPDSANASVGASLGTLGFGVSASSVTDWHIKDGDQLQWRAMISGMSFDFEGSNQEISDIEYDDSEYSIRAAQLGLDWYPFTSDGWSKKIFFSGGVMYVVSDFSAEADMEERFIVGNTVVNKGDIDSFKQETESNGVLPYLSMGWGNKIIGEPGFDFIAELGMAYQLSDPDVQLVVVDPNGHLSQSDLDKEEEEIRDDTNSILLFGTLTVAYHF